MAILQPPQSKDLKLIVPKHFTFMASNTIFIALGIPNNYLEKTMLIRSTLPTGSYKTSLDTLLPPKLLSLHCNQINKNKNELDDQPSSLLARMHVSNYKATFSPMHLVFLVLDTHRPHLDFKILDENNNEVILRTFYLQLLHKEWTYTTMKQQNFSRFKPYGTTRTTRITNISLQKINWNWSIFAWWNWSSWKDCQKNETIQYNHRHHRHRSNYINSDHWRNCSICQRCWSARWHCLK